MTQIRQGSADPLIGTAAGPTTTAGLAFLNDIFDVTGQSMPMDPGAVIAAIEQEAIAAFARDLAEKVRALDYRMVEWWAMDGKTYSLHQVVTRSDVLHLLDAGVPQEGASE